MEACLKALIQAQDTAITAAQLEPLSVGYLQPVLNALNARTVGANFRLEILPEDQSVPTDRHHNKPGTNGIAST